MSKGGIDWERKARWGKCILCETGVNLFNLFDLACVEKKEVAATPHKRIYSWSEGVFLFISARSTAFNTFIDLPISYTHSIPLYSLSLSFFFFLLLFFISFAHQQHPLFPDYKSKMFQLCVCVLYFILSRSFFLLLLLQILLPMVGETGLEHTHIGWGLLIRNTLISLTLSHSNELLFLGPVEQAFQAFSNYLTYIHIHRETERENILIW